jgi:hypothetical protein
LKTVAPAAAMFACVLLSGCVGPANPSAARAAEFANVVSRASACRAATPSRTTLDLFLKAEKAKGADEAQVASARATYISVSEASSVNAALRPEPCTREERAALKERMAGFKAGTFDGF